MTAQRYHINVFYSREDGGYIADIPELRMCSAFGETPEDALREVLRAEEAWLESAKEKGKPIPRPATARSSIKLPGDRAVPSG